MAMNRHVKDGQDHEALRRLAVVLITLAAIAESLVSRSAPVRCLLIFLLCRAEARVSDLAFRTGAAGLPASMCAGSPVRLLGGPGEVARLALRFRAFAATFFALSRQAPYWLRLARRNDAVCLSADRRSSIRPGRRSGLSFADTS
jgi:hypothetical protein